MEEASEWNFGANVALLNASSLSVHGVLAKIMAGIEDENGGAEDPTPRIPLGDSDPSVFPYFRTTPDAVDAVVFALRLSQFNCYAPCAGLAPARRLLDTAKKLGILVVADEVYGHLTYGSNSFANGSIWCNCSSPYTRVYIKKMGSTRLATWLDSGK